MLSLKNLFRPGPVSRDLLTQPQREAIVDLLNYCAMADRNITRTEEITIEDLEYQLDWDHKTDFDYYVNKSIGAVRRVLESKDEQTFLEQIRKRLDTKKSRDTATELCRKILEADDATPADARGLFAKVKVALS